MSTCLSQEPDWASAAPSKCSTAGECLNIRKGSSQDIESKTEFDYAAIYALSTKGSLHEEVYIVPRNAPASFELTVENGELVETYDLNRSSFDDQELLQDQIPTHDGDTVNIAQWGPVPLHR